MSKWNIGRSTGNTIRYVDLIVKMPPLGIVTPGLPQVQTRPTMVKGN